MNEKLYSDIDKIRDLDEEIFGIVKESLITLVKDIEKSLYPNTGKAIVMFLTKINFIKNSIFDVCYTADIYSVNILYRSLIEHFLRHQYLFLNYVKFKNDDVGKDYYIYCDMGENQEFLKAIRASNKIFDGEYYDINIWEELCKIDEKFKGISPKDLKASNEQFRYRNIITFLKTTLGVKSAILQSIIPVYAELSSFVHGGPYSENILLKNKDEKERIKNIISICEMTLELSNNVILLTYLFASQVKEEYGFYYNKIDKIIANSKK